MYNKWKDEGLWLHVVSILLLNCQHTVKLTGGWRVSPQCESERHVSVVCVAVEGACLASQCANPCLIGCQNHFLHWKSPFLGNWICTLVLPMLTMRHPTWSFSVRPTEDLALLSDCPAPAYSQNRHGLNMVLIHSLHLSSFGECFSFKKHYFGCVMLAFHYDTSRNPVSSCVLCLKIMLMRCWKSEWKIPWGRARRNLVCGPSLSATFDSGEGFGSQVFLSPIFHSEVCEIFYTLMIDFAQVLQPGSYFTKSNMGKQI